MTAKTKNQLLIGGLAALSLTFIFLYIKGRQVFNRVLAADVIDKYVGRAIIDRGNEKQDTYLFAWWEAIVNNRGSFTHNGNNFSTKTGTFFQQVN